MLETLRASYLARFSNLLSTDVQSKVIAAIDSGAVVKSVYDPAAGTTAAMLEGTDATGTLWRADLDKAEAKAIGNAVADCLNSFPDLQRKIINSLLENGAGVLITVDHTQGAAELFLHGRDGKAMSLAKLAVQPTIH